MTSIDNNICGYLFAMGFFMGGLGILLAGISNIYNSWRGWQPDDNDDSGK